MQVITRKQLLEELARHKLSYKEGGFGLLSHVVTLNVKVGTDISSGRPIVAKFTCERRQNDSSPMFFELDHIYDEANRTGLQLSEAFRANFPDPMANRPAAGHPVHGPGGEHGDPHHGEHGRPGEHGK